MMRHVPPQHITERLSADKDDPEALLLALEWFSSLELEIGDQIALPEGTLERAREVFNVEGLTFAKLH